MKRENKVGPRTEPWGTPCGIHCVSESHPFTLTTAFVL